MKRVMFLYLGILLSLTSLAQESARKQAKSPDYLKPHALVPVSEFQLVLKQLKNCPCMLLNHILSQFTQDAWIYVSAPGSPGKISRKRPRAYFMAVNALTCMAIPKYSYMNFSYLPVKASDGYDTTLNGRPTIAFPMVQYFQAVDKNGHFRVSDITIKQVHIAYEQTVNGEWVFKIAGILVTDSRPCAFNEQDVAAN